MLAIGEKYPELKANSNFLQLQKELADTEDKIVKARQFYNDTVTKYNTAIMMFPRSAFAGIFGFKKMELLEVAASERQATRMNGDTFKMN